LSFFIATAVYAHTLMMNVNRNYAQETVFNMNYKFHIYRSLMMCTITDLAQQKFDF